MKQDLYYSYSEYLKKRYGQKVYKLPVCLPVGCPNRIGESRGCAFCADVGTGFESAGSSRSVISQLLLTRALIEEKYHAHRFIAYFQNYTNTFLPITQFEEALIQAAETEDIVEIAVSTRPDCIRGDYLECMNRIAEKYGVRMTVELGLQTANYHTLRRMHRGHGLAEFIDAVMQLRRFPFDICAHVILNLPGDSLEDAIETARILSALQIPIVKIHSLYIAKNSILYDWYKDGTITLCSKEEYLNRLAHFVEHLSPDIAIERLFSRVPEKDAVFSNWGTSWWKLKDEFEHLMISRDSRQGKSFRYLNGAALELLTVGEE